MKPPFNNWILTQKWVDVIFLHFKVDKEKLQPLVPFELDLFKGSAYISIVAFMNKDTRPNFLLPLSFISDFGEVNIRTYVNHEGKKGIYFLSMEGAKWLSVQLSKLSLLPYRFSKMNIEAHSFESTNSKNGDHFKIKYKIAEKANKKTELAIWLTERYSLFHKYGELFIQFDVYHHEWPLNYCELVELKINYEKLNHLINKEHVLTHYSTGVQAFIYKIH